MTDHAKNTMTAAQFEAAMEGVEASLDMEARKADLMARVRKMHYDASIRKGFTAEEALFLCTQTEFE